MKRYLLSFFVILSSISAFGCNLSSFTLNFVAQNGGNWDISTTICIGGGVTGFVQGADQSTGTFAAFFYGSGLQILASSPASITSTFRGCTLFNTPNGGAISACTDPDPLICPYQYNQIDDAIWFTNNFCDLTPPCSAPCDLGFACVLSTALCGNVSADCFTLNFTTNIKPDSIRVVGVEGASQAFAGCYPNQDMLIDLTSVPITQLHLNGFAKPGYNVIEWDAISNSTYFVLQRYDTQGWVVMDSTTSNTIIDPNPHIGLNLYRIQQIEVTGDSTNSTPIEVYSVLVSQLAWVKVAPIPTPGLVTASFISGLTSNMEMRVYDVRGMQISQETCLIQRGLNTFDVNLANVEVGVYFLIVKLSNGDQLVRKLMKY